jgi:hypothetical protein
MRCFCSSFFFFSSPSLGLLNLLSCKPSYALIIPIGGFNPVKSVWLRPPFFSHSLLIPRQPNAVKTLLLFRCTKCMRPSKCSGCGVPKAFDAVGVLRRRSFLVVALPLSCGVIFIAAQQATHILGVETRLSRAVSRCFGF